MKRIVQALLLLLAFGPAQAALQSRMSGQAIYDSTQGITWLADANRAGTSGYVVNGRMTAAQAAAWITSLNAARYLGVSDWRLPNTAQPDATCDTEIAPGENGGYKCTGSEMGHLFWADGISQTTPGPFSNVNIGAGYTYLSRTPYAPFPSRSWTFEFISGYQDPIDEGEIYYAWAVRPGDIDADGDGFAEGSDNCTQVANPTQLDADGDGFGNLCDGDLNNSGTVTATDFSLLRSVLNQLAGSGALAAVADMNGSGTVTSADFGLLRARLNTVPGPSYRTLQYLLDVTRSGNGTGTIASSPAGINCGSTCSANFIYNTPVTLTATPQSGSTFTGWSGACTGTGACIVTMDAARSVTANFVPIFLLTVSRSGSGTVTSNPAGINCGADCSESYQQATPVALTATPTAGSIFAGWSGACSGTGSCNVTMSAARSVTATFTSLMDTNPACSSNTFMGTVSGDTTSPMLSASQIGERWYRVHITEDDGTPFSLEYVSARISLTSPPGVDYDLAVYCETCGGSLAGGSTQGAGLTDVVTVRRDDNVLSDQSFDVLIEVRYWSGQSGASWNLTVTGDAAANAETCS
jgi:hypothetical protein